MKIEVGEIYRIDNKKDWFCNAEGRLILLDGVKLTQVETDATDFSNSSVKLLDKAPTSAMLKTISGRFSGGQLARMGYYKPATIKPVPYSLAVNDKGLLTIVRPFTSKDNLRPEMAAINFDSAGVQATDAHVLIWLKGRPETTGLYDLHGFLKDEKFPTYSVVIPDIKNCQKFPVNPAGLYNFCQVIKPFNFKFTICHVAGEKRIGFFIENLQKVSRAMLQIAESGWTACFSGKNRPFLFAHEKALVLIMPFFLENESPALGSTNIDLNLETNYHWSFELNRSVGLSGDYNTGKTAPRKAKKAAPAPALAPNSFRERKLSMFETHDTKTIDSNPAVSKGGRLDRYWRSVGMKKRYGKWTGNRTDYDFKNINQDEIVSQYQLRGFEYGNWVPQEERFNFLAATAYCLEDLGKVLGFTNIGMDGHIGIAFGARGRSPRAAAHFEPDTFMINLTRKGGSGALAHEYGHALDYFFGTFIEQSKKSRALSGGSTTARNPDEAITGQPGTARYLCNQVINAYIFTEKGELTTSFSNLIYKKASNEYWFRRNELFARAFEQYVQHKISEQGLKNSFLAAHKYEDGVYLTQTDLNRIIPLFDQLINKIRSYAS